MCSTTHDPLAERLATALELRVDHIGRKRIFDTDRRLVLARILLDHVRGRFPRHRNDPQAIAISAQVLRRRLRSNIATIRNTLLRLISTFKDGDFDVGGRTSRAITFHPVMVKQAVQVYRDAATAPLVVAPQPKKLAPTVWHKVTIPGVLPEVTLAMADRAIERCDPQDIEMLGALVDVRYSIALHSGLPNAFDGETTAGRLNPVGVVSPVTLPRRVRALLLPDTGWWDYDLASCHLRILSDLGRHLGLSTSAIERYLRDKSTAHEKWANDLEHHRPDDFKQIVLSFQNGARRSSEPETTLGDLLGPEKADRWLQRAYVQEFLTEISNIVKPVVKQARVGKKGNTYRNAAGLTLEPKTYPKACNHIWTGYEVWVMRELLKRLQVLQPGAFKAYIYDGFWSATRLSDAQISDLESHIRRRSGKSLGVELSIMLKATPFAPPTAPRVTRSWHDLSSLHIEKRKEKDHV